MGQLELTIASALGRSPYDEEVLHAESEGVDDGQQYDHKGHPVNPETRKWTKDYVRASNEVMQVAGVIENVYESIKREEALQQRLEDENDLGVKRLEVGRIVFVAGVWGVCGLRRRILLYKSCDRPFLGLMRQQISSHSLLGLCAAGIPVLAAYQGLDWAGFLLRALCLGPYQGPITGWSWRSIGNNIIDISLASILLQFRMFGTLQQLDLISARRLGPPPLSLIPFTRQSPIQWPAATTPKAFMSQALVTAAPLALLLGWVKLRNELTAYIYAPIYRRLPRPPQPVEFVRDASQMPTRDRSAPSRQTTDSADDSEQAENLPSLGFDVEESTEVAGGGGNWSAELRSDERPTAHITTLTMLPSLLAADALALGTAELVCLPLEAVMCRVLSNGFLGGRDTHGMWTMFTFSKRAFGNVLITHVAEMAGLAIVWACYCSLSKWVGGIEEETAKVDTPAILIERLDD